MLRPITVEIRTCEQATKPQTNQQSCLQFSLAVFLQHKNIPKIFLVFTVSQFDCNNLKNVKRAICLHQDIFHERGLCFSLHFVTHGCVRV